MENGNSSKRFRGCFHDIIWTDSVSSLIYLVMIYLQCFRFWLNSHHWSMSRTFTLPSCASHSSPPQPSCTSPHWLISLRLLCQMLWLWSDHHSCKVRFILPLFICLLTFYLLFTQFSYVLLEAKGIHVIDFFFLLFYVHWMITFIQLKVYDGKLY